MIKFHPQTPTPPPTTPLSTSTSRAEGLRIQEPRTGILMKHILRQRLIVNDTAEERTI